MVWSEKDKDKGLEGLGDCRGKACKGKALRAAAQCPGIQRRQVGLELVSGEDCRKSEVWGWGGSWKGLFGRRAVQSHLHVKIALLAVEQIRAEEQD